MPVSRLLPAAAAACAVAVVAAAALGVKVFYDRADRHHGELVALAALDARIDEARALSWALSTGQSGPASQAHVRRQRDLLAELRAAANDLPPSVAAPLDAYADAIERELLVSLAGSTAPDIVLLTAARERAFVSVDAGVKTEARRRAASLRRADRVAEAGSAVTMALAAISVAVLAWRFARVHRSAEEHALRRSEARFRNLVNDSTDIIAVVDETLRVTYISPGVKTTLGYELNDITGRALTTLVEEDDRDEVRRTLMDLTRRAGGRCSTEIRLRAEDNTARYAELSASNLLRDPDIGGLVLTIHDATARKVLEQRLRRQALHDPLTDLPNRDLFIQNVESQLGRSSDAARIAVLFIDLDKFKSVNDSYGHETGDALLIAVARRLQACARPRDLVARLSGDEFAVLLQGVRGIADVELHCARIIDVMCAPVEAGGTLLDASASVGAALDDGQTESAGAPLRRADLAMYAAKRAGGGQYAVFNPAIHDPNAPVRMTPMNGDLREAS